MDMNIKQYHVDGIVAKFNADWKGRDCADPETYVKTVRDIQTYCCHILGSGMKSEDAEEILDGLLGGRPMPKGDESVTLTKEEAVAVIKKMGGDDKAVNLKAEICDVADIGTIIIKEK